MIDDFYGQAWAESSEKFASDVTAGLARLAGWLRRPVKASDEVPAVTIAAEAAVGADAEYCLHEYRRELQRRLDGGDRTSQLIEVMQ